ncbi:hypothetical protein [Tsukamurella sp. 1534]|uniref:hypothetical protein n=1 Tax=Tsukamurella sp. 1534 TaxID=1151061 RepID=UPI0003051E89|nr:hypothetical protein [Tsukamurella sp. 1534]
MTDHDDPSALDETAAQAKAEAQQAQIDAQAAVGAEFDPESATELEELESEE